MSQIYVNIKSIENYFISCTEFNLYYQFSNFFYRNDQSEWNESAFARLGKPALVALACAVINCR